MTAHPPRLKFVSSNRRVREDRRFVVGQGRYVADIVVDEMLHVAIVPSQHPAARIVSIDTSQALTMPGVVYALTGEELAKAVDPLMNGLDTPKVRRYPLAVGQVRYAGEWVVAVVAESRAQAEDAIEKVRIEYEPLPYVIDAEEAITAASAKVHPEHGTNVLLDRTFVWGEVDRHFAESPRHLKFQVKWGRNSTVPIETFGVVAKWDPWREMLDVWASIQMPKYPDQISRALRIPANNVRVHHDVDVGGSYGVKRGIKQTVLVSHLSRIIGRPVRLIEDRLENMRAGDAHGPERLFDVEVAFNDRGIVKSMKMRALDNVGAYAGRSPFQLGKPIGAIVGPYKIESVQYRAIATLSNKAAQEAVRGFGQSPTNYAIETAIDKVAGALGLDRIEVRRRNFIRSDEFPYLIPSGTHYDSGDYHTVVDKVLRHADYDALVRERDALRASGMMAGIGIAACLEPSGGNSSFEPLLNEKNTTTTWMDSCRINIDGVGFVTVAIHTTSSGQGHETLAATVVGEVLEIDPDKIRIVRPDSLASLPSNTPVGSRMAIMMGGACYHAAQKLKSKLTQIAAHQFGVAENDAVYAQGNVTDPRSGKTLSWIDLVNIGHRQYHALPPGMDPGLETTHVMQVPTATKLPEDGRVQMYPCHSFEFHLVLVAFDPEIAKPQIRRYVIGHDCGTVINPHIVKGMTLGGIAHGLGATLLEEFVYDDEGQILTQTFMDYLLPSSHEMPDVEIVHHCTPSPFTVFGQKGSGESGYLGAPAAISGAINDAVSSLGISFSRLPIRIAAISDAIAAADKIKKG
ncbi:xanthine dehydrogenase family protein molybdopterin-binding subunit [Bradyrhizobium tropiciagri]|uniref:xanthine dehydrogenase family protein molybdopterin-binding subunit n=1 Tax=Bradyrhizobium tropiciagri TaxID=312253 RepID=UPI001BA9FDB9|nr:xanthine dehydrogenase family protein molybdopterin-binding subunit [Bradyrhizobium tropiciagri]MBR0869427.1 xanthine dehydrogenase family protein molybdopterin-binding subunit [Bradyrhizobium tropiciagri]